MIQELAEVQGGEGIPRDEDVMPVAMRAARRYHADRRAAQKKHRAKITWNVRRRTLAPASEWTLGRA